MKVITIGRSSECSVVINDVKVSRVHAQLVQDDKSNISVVDLGSTNGTRVNGKRITGEMRLNPGDELRVGDTVLPWQNYIATMPSQTFQPIASNTQSPATIVGEDMAGMPAGQPRKNKNTLLWIIIAVVLGLIVIGGVVWLLLGRGPASSNANDTIRITDTVREGDKDYENYLKGIIAEYDSIINARPQPTPGKKQPTDSLGAKAKQGIKDSTDAKQGVSTKSPNDKPVPITQLPPQNPDEDLNNQFEQLVKKGYPQKIGYIYAEVIGGKTNKTQDGQRKAVLKKFKELNPEQKRNVIARVKDIVNK